MASTGQSNNLAIEHSSEPDSMPHLELFFSILKELFDNRTQDSGLQAQRYRLKFVNRSLRSYEDTERTLRDYLKCNFSQEEYAAMASRISAYNTESCICELVLELIRFIELKLDMHQKLFEDILSVVDRVRQLKATEDEFKEGVIIECALLVYDSFGVLRSMRKKVLELARTYHVPMYYDTERGDSFRVRSSLLTTYKNLLTVMDDFATLNNALWIVRHGGGQEEKQAHASQEQSVVDLPEPHHVPPVLVTSQATQPTGTLSAHHMATPTSSN